VTIVSTKTARRRLAHDPHSKSVQLAIEDVAAALQEHLGQALLAVIVDKNVRTLTRWSTGDARPPAAEEKLLRDTYQVLELVLTVEESTVARAWFMGMNPQLDDASPAEALADGRARLVLAAARSYVDAG
jgi:hypothetical protein